MQAHRKAYFEPQEDTAAVQVPDTKAVLAKLKAAVEAEKAKVTLEDFIGFLEGCVC